MFHRLRHLPGFGAGPRGEGEDVEVGDRKFLQEAQGVQEGNFVLARKAHYDIGTYTDVRHPPVNLLYPFPVLPRGIWPPHSPQYLSIAALEGKVEVSAQPLRAGDELQKLLGKSHGLEGAQPEAWPLHLLEEGREKFGEAGGRGQVLPVGAYVHPREHYLHVTRHGEPPGLLDDVLRGPAPARPPCQGHYTIGAPPVAAVLDLEEGTGTFRKTRNLERDGRSLPHP